MKLTAKYNLKDIWNKAKGKIDKYGKFVMVGIALSTVVACEKPDPAPEPTPVTPTPVTPTTQKHNKTLVFDLSGENLHFDTINYYLAQPDVDSVFMQAATEDLITNCSPNNTHNVLLFLQERCDISPRVRGKGGLLLNSQTDTVDLNMALRQGFDARINGHTK